MTQSIDTKQRETDAESCVSSSRNVSSFQWHSSPTHPGMTTDSWTGGGTNEGVKITERSQGKLSRWQWFDPWPEAMYWV